MDLKLKVPPKSLLAILVSFVLTIPFIFAIRGDYPGLNKKLTRVPLLSSLILQRQKARETADSLTLSHTKPSFESLIDFMKAGGKQGPKNLKTYILYYERVARAFPQLADAQGMLGFCYFYDGQIEKARKAYRNAITLRPEFFWFYYDLGSIYFYRGEYKQAAEQFKKGSLVDINVTFQTIYTSGVYQQIFLPVVNFGDYPVADHLMRGYQDGYELLIVSDHFLKDYTDMFQQSLTAIQRGLDKDGRFYYYAGLAAYLLAQYKDAIYLFQECVKVDPDFSDAHFYWGESLKALGMDEVAKKYLKQSGVEDTIKDVLSPSGKLKSHRIAPSAMPAEGAVLKIF